MVMQWLKFNNSNASSIRTVMIANCPADDDDAVTRDCCQTRTNSPSKVVASHTGGSERRNPAGCSYNETSSDQCAAQKQTKQNVTTSQWDSLRSDSSLVLNGTIEYDPEYWDAELRCRNSETKRRKFEMDTADFPCACCDVTVGGEVVEDDEVSEAVSNSSKLSDDPSTSPSNQDIVDDNTNVNTCEQNLYVGQCGQCKFEGVDENICVSGNSLTRSDMAASKYTAPELPVCDKLLIFTRGTLTYTPHQIGIKRIQPLDSLRTGPSSPSAGPVRFLLPSVEENQHGMNRPHDEVDEVIDMDGHVIGMSLSPDHK